jgi:hypothetical protein
LVIQEFGFVSSFDIRISDFNSGVPPALPIAIEERMDAKDLHAIFQ